MEGTLSSSLLCLLCCLLGAGTIQEVLGDQSTPATVLPSLPASTVPVGTEGAAATSDPEKSILMVEQAKSVPTNYSHPMDHNLVTEKPTPAGPAFDASLLPEEPVTLTHDLGQPSPTMKPDVNVSGDSMVTVDGTLLQRNQSAEYHERTPNASVPEGSTASSTTLLDTKRMTANLGSTQEMATAFRTSGLPDPKLASNTEMAPSTATDHHLSYTVSTALHSTRTPAGISKDAVPWAFGPTSIQQEKTAVVDVGDIDTDTAASWRSSPWARMDPLMLVVIAIFVIMLGVLALVGFLRYKQRRNQTEFRRLQDLPMDDMMEDTPLSMYSY